MLTLISDTPVYDASGIPSAILLIIPAFLGLISTTTLGSVVEHLTLQAHLGDDSMSLGCVILAALPPVTCRLASSVPVRLRPFIRRLPTSGELDCHLHCLYLRLRPCGCGTKARSSPPEAGSHGEIDPLPHLVCRAL